MYEQEIRGNLEEAIRLFDLIVRQYSENKEIAAKAQLQLGICYTLTGDGKAEEAFRSVLNNFPNQIQAVATAEQYLKTGDEEKINPLVKIYFERNPPDPMTSVSYDGRFLAFTNWTKCNLAVKNLETEEVRTVAVSDWPGVREFPYHPAWSRDGKYIACSWYRGLDYSDLRVFSLDASKNQTILSLPNTVLHPCDWSPDGQTILCETLTRHSTDKADHFLSLVSPDGTHRRIVSLGPHSRGFQFSPDGRFVTFDRLVRNERHIFIYDIEKGSETQVSSGISDLVGFNGPVWTEDGRQLLYHYGKRGRNDLWAQPILEGIATGEPYLVHSNIIGELMKIKGIDEVDLSRTGKEPSPLQSQLRKLPKEFMEEFDGPSLGDGWDVWEWDKKNIYGYKHFGRYSLTERPGRLRLSLDPVMSISTTRPYMPSLNDWLYWHYPALEVSRAFQGNRWTLEIKVLYSLVDGLNNRGLKTLIQFESGQNSGTSLYINASKPSYSLAASLLRKGEENSSPSVFLSRDDLIGKTDFEVLIRIERRGSAIKVEMAEEGMDYRTVLDEEIAPGSPQSIQRIILTGNSWFVPAGSCADYDYIRLNTLGDYEDQKILNHHSMSSYTGWTSEKAAGRQPNFGLCKIFEKLRLRYSHPSGTVLN